LDSEENLLITIHTCLVELWVHSHTCSTPLMIVRMWIYRQVDFQIAYCPVNSTPQDPPVKICCNINIVQ